MIGTMCSFSDGGKLSSKAAMALGVIVAATLALPFALLRHHVGEIGERETFADAALAVDRDDLRRFFRSGRVDVGE